MAHYAEVINNVVHQVVVTDNSWTHEETLLWLHTHVSNNIWLQTSYNGRIRGKFAGIGDIYNPNTDTFIPPIVLDDDEVSIPPRDISI